MEIQSAAKFEVIFRCPIKTWSHLVFTVDQGNYVQYVAELTRAVVWKENFSNCRPDQRQGEFRNPVPDYG
jgi:hypothetical protein